MSREMERRGFLKVVGAGSAGATLAGCTTNPEALMPYVTAPEEVTPGVATWYASVCGECASGCGIRVRTREGRAVMIEGNPDHPLSRGGLCSRGVAALQGLYYPDRLASPQRAVAGGFEDISWEQALDILVERLGGDGQAVFLTGRHGPAEGDLLDRFVGAVGGARVTFDPLDDVALRTAVDIGFGVKALPRYDIAAARHLVSFGADFLETWVSPAAFAADFAAMHGLDHGEKGRFVFVGPRLSLTGLNADEWIPARPGSEADIALAVAGELVRNGAGAGPYTELVAGRSLAAAAEAAGVAEDKLAELAARFAEGDVLALGPGLAGHHAAAAAANLAVLVLNEAAGNIGKTIHIPDAPDREVASSHGDVAATLSTMEAGAYGVAVVAGANPAYALPPAAGFREAFDAVPYKVALVSALDETAAMADLVLPVAHPLESWGDSEPVPGAYAVRQPVMRPVPLFDSRAMGDVLIEAGRRLGHDFGAATQQAYVRAAAEARLDALGVAADEGGEARWRSLLRTGAVVASSASGSSGPGADDALVGKPAISRADVVVRKFLRPPSALGPLAVASRTLQAPATAVGFGAPSLEGAGDLALLVHPSSRFGDGTHATRPWLRELPDPVSKIMWQSWVEMNPAAAERAGIRREGEIVRVESEHGVVELPVWFSPGIREDAVAVAMGGGRENHGEFASGLANDNGANPMTLLPAATDERSGALSLVSVRVTVSPTGAWERLASAEGTRDVHHHQDDRRIALAVKVSALGHGEGGAGEHDEDGHGQLQELQEGGGFVPVPTEGRAQDFPLPGSDFGEYAEAHPRWAMAVDLDKCTGCSACVTACQAENNIPWVGERETQNGRELHWLRLERYYETVDATHAGPLDVRFLPMLCQHCNNAPCEPVCPVFAAYHTPDGLNAQVYNRCVGTRYCANNCPYKVRVFNWYSYKDNVESPLNWQFNPDVTVRDNGVMEKCTFCVQRIREAGNRAAAEGREMRDGEVRTACQSVCPCQAITFGNIKDSESAVATLAAAERSYRVLDELINTQPAVHYLKKTTFHDVDESGH